MDISCDLLQPFIIFFDKKSSNTDRETRTNSVKQQLAEELHKPIIRNFEK